MCDWWLGGWVVVVGGGIAVGPLQTAANTDAERQAQMFLQPKRYKADRDTDAEAAAALTDADLHALKTKTAMAN